MSEAKYIMDAATAAKKLRRMALEILENNAGEDHIVLAGIHGSGSVIARNIRRALQEIGPVTTDLITVTLDKKVPGIVALDPEDNFDGKVVVVIDDVTNSGKTLLYALKPFITGHPKKIQALVLVERSHKTFPVHPDYVGISIATTAEEHISVEVDGDEVRGAFIQ